jgi:hypothetical protein
MAKKSNGGPPCPEARVIAKVALIAIPVLCVVGYLFGWLGNLFG